MFIPKRHQKFQHGVHRTTRRCQWCCDGPHPTSVLTQVMEGPMRWHFCDGECARVWMQHRHEKGWHLWLRRTPVERSQIPKHKRYATLTDLGCDPLGLCDLHNIDVPVPEA